MAKPNQSRQARGSTDEPRTETQRLAKQLGVAASTIRSRRHRGQALDAKPQTRLSDAQKHKIARATGRIEDIAARYGVSASTVKRVRRAHRQALDEHAT